MRDGCEAAHVAVAVDDGAGAARLLALHDPTSRRVDVDEILALTAATY
jgi:hypothetical protein